MAVAIPIPYRTPYYEVYLDIGKGKAKWLDITSYVNTLRLSRSMEKTDSLTLIGFDRIENLTLLDNKYFTKGAKIYYRYGYINWRMSSLRVAQITELEPVFGSLPTWKLTADDLGVPMKRICSNTIYYSKTSSEIAEIIGNKYGLKLFIEKTTLKRPVVATGNRTDFQILKWLASTEGDWQAYVTGDEMYFYRKKNGTKSVTTFAYGDYEVFTVTINFIADVSADADEGAAAGLDVETGKVYAGLDKEKAKNEKALGDEYFRLFDVNTGQFAGVEVQKAVKQLNEANGKATELIKKYAESKASTADAADYSESINKLFTDKLNGKISSDAYPTPELVLKKAKGKKEKAKKNILNCIIDAQLNPLLGLDDIVTVTNIQKKYSGNWWVWEIEDEIQSNSVATSRIVAGRNHFVKKEVSTSNETDKNKTTPDPEGTSKKTVPLFPQTPNGKAPKLELKKQ
jgi:phage protein D